MLATKPTLVVLACLMIMHLAFYVRPIFLTYGETVFLRTVPQADGAGADLVRLSEFGREWQRTAIMPYKSLDNESPFYRPPFMLAIFSPLYGLPTNQAHMVLSFLTVASFLLGAFFIPYLLGRSVYIGFFTLVYGLTGLTSYGLDFQLDRGQFDVIAMIFVWMAFALAARPSIRGDLVAMLLISIAAHIKLYPAIFALPFLCAHRTWRHLLLCCTGFAAFNLVLLCAFGFENAKQFLLSIGGFSNPLYWAGNHSISSFVATMPEALSAMRPWFGYVLFAAYLSMLTAGFWKVYRTSTYRFDARLVLLCLMGAMFIPSESSDYKLAVLAPAVILFADHCTACWQNRIRSGWSMAFTGMVSLCYFSTLYSYVNMRIAMPWHGWLLHNNFPPLFLMAIVATLSIFMLPALPTPAGEKPHESSPCAE